MASAAVTFGSFGDIVTIAQLVSALFSALGDISDAPAEIAALSDDLNGYLLVLPHVERLLLENDQSFEPETRAGIERGLTRCMDTLLAIRRHVDAFASRVQQRGGKRFLLAYTSAVRWRVFGGRKEVSALHARLDKQLSFVKMCLGVSQSHNQRALHNAAERNGVVAEQILLLVHDRPPEIEAGASVMQIYDCYSRISYQAFAVVPLRVLPAYLDPLITLLEPAKLSAPCFGRLSFRDPSFVKLVTQLNPDEPLSYRETIIEMSCPWELPGRSTNSVIFQFSIISASSGEQHAILGVRPSYQKDAVSLILSDVLRGEFPNPDNAESYVPEKKKIAVVQSVVENYCMLLRFAHRPAISVDDDWRRPVRVLAQWLDGHRSPKLLQDSTASDPLQHAQNQFHDQFGHNDMQHRLWDLLASNPRTPESLRSTQAQLRRISFTPMPIRLAALFDPMCIRIDLVAAMLNVGVGGDAIGTTTPPAYGW